MAAFVRPYAQKVTAEIYPVQLIVMRTSQVLVLAMNESSGFYILVANHIP